MKGVHVGSFTGGMDRDSDLHEVKPSNYFDALNVRGGHGSNYDGKLPILGNEEVNIDLPEGINRVIGTVEDAARRKVIFFVYNTLNNHTIWEYDPFNVGDLNPAGTVEKIIQGDFLSFRNRGYIHSAQTIPDDKLYWTDASKRVDWVGSDPRKINHQKARIEGKVLKYDLILSPDYFGPSAQYFLKIRNLDGTLDTGLQNIYTAPLGGGSPATTINGLQVALDNFDVVLEGPWDGIYTGTEPVKKVKIYHQQPGKVIELYGGVGGTTDNYTKLVATNHYPLDVDTLEYNITEEMTYLIKPQPAQSFTPIHEYDEDIDENNIFGNSFKFRYRYVFDDNERSAWGPCSYISTNYRENLDGAFGINNNRLNKIRLDLTDDLLDDDRWLCFIRGIEVAVSTSDDSPWRLVQYYTREDLGAQPLKTIDFLNARAYPVIASDDAGTATQQSLKNQDFVPKLCRAMATIYDADGTQVLALGGTQEFYDRPEILAEISTQIGYKSIPGFLADQDSTLKSFKAGGSYRIWVQFEDFFGRKFPPAYVGKWNVPFHFHKFGPYPEVNILTGAPSEAVRYRLIMTKNENQARYYQEATEGVDFVKYVESSGEFEVIPTSGDLTQATHIAFRFRLTGDSSGDLPTIFENTLEDGSRFLPQEGDVLQIVDWDAGTATLPDPPYTVGDLSRLSFLIAGYDPLVEEPVSNEKYVIYADIGDFPYVNANFLLGLSRMCEIYRRSSVDSDQYAYEIGPTGSINESGECEVIDLQGYGDTYLNAVKYIDLFDPSDPVDTRIYEYPSLHKGGDEHTDFGRLVSIDTDESEQDRGEIIRVSDPLIETSALNGFSSFRGSNYILAPKTNGPIEKLAMVDQVLLAVSSNKTQPVYVGRGRVTSLSGDESIGRSTRLLNLGPELDQSWGTIHPESFVVEGGRAYCFDVYNGLVWSYSSGGGQVPVFFNMQNYFREQGRSRMNNLPFQRALGGYDRLNQIYILTLEDADRVIALQNITIGFQPSLGQNQVPSKWISRYGFFPEYYGSAGQAFVSFAAGVPWLHNSENVDACSFYGVQQDAWVEVVVNDKQQLVKLFDAIAVNSSVSVDAPSIIIPSTPNYPGGMGSQLIANKWTSYEGVQRASFLRDQTDSSQEFSSIIDPIERLVAALLRGRPLRGEVMIVRIRFADLQKSGILKKYRVYYTESHQK